METQVKVAIIGGCITIIGILLTYSLHLPPFTGESPLVMNDPGDSLPITWDFLDSSLDGWERTGTTLPWKTLSDSVVWYSNWGDGDNVVVFDSCDKPSQNVYSTTGIKKSVDIPTNAKSLVADILKIEEDGGIRFMISDSTGNHLIGEEHLSGREKRTVSYSIAKWAGQTVIIKIMGFGWGGAATESCPEDTKACCGEYIGLDKIEII